MTDYMNKVAGCAEAGGIVCEFPEDDCLRVSFPGKNAESIPVDIFFSETETNVVELICFAIATLDDERLQNGLIICNELNRKNKWVKFCLDSDNDLLCKIDLFVKEGSCGEECICLARRMAALIDDHYPEIRQAL